MKFIAIKNRWTGDVLIRGNFRNLAAEIEIGDELLKEGG